MTVKKLKEVFSDPTLRAVVGIVCILFIILVSLLTCGCMSISGKLSTVDPQTQTPIVAEWCYNRFIFSQEIKGCTVDLPNGVKVNFMGQSSNTEALNKLLEVAGPLLVK